MKYNLDEIVLKHKKRGLKCIALAFLDNSDCLYSTNGYNKEHYFNINDDIQGIIGAQKSTRIFFPLSVTMIKANNITEMIDFSKKTYEWIFSQLTYSTPFYFNILFFFNETQLLQFPLFFLNKTSANSQIYGYELDDHRLWSCAERKIIGYCMFNSLSLKELYVNAEPCCLCLATIPLHLNVFFSQNISKELDSHMYRYYKLEKKPLDTYKLTREYVK